MWQQCCREKGQTFNQLGRPESGEKEGEEVGSAGAKTTVEPLAGSRKVVAGERLGQTRLGGCQRERHRKVPKRRGKAFDIAKGGSSGRGRNKKSALKDYKERKGRRRGSIKRVGEDARSRHRRPCLVRKEGCLEDSPSIDAREKRNRD